MKRRLLIGLIMLGWRMRMYCASSVILLALSAPASAQDWIRYYPPGGGVSLSGTNVWTGTNQFAAGTVSAPGIALGGATTGFYQAAGSQIQLTLGGTATSLFVSTLMRNGNGFEFGWTSSADPISANLDIGLKRASAGVMIVTGGASSTYGSIAVAAIYPATILAVGAVSPPTVSACGTTPSVVAGSNTAGRLTTGSGAALQSCTITFVPAIATAPVCTCTNETNILLVRGTATATTLVCDSAVAGTMESDVITYLCVNGTP